MQRLLTEDEVDRAVENPPEDTRAYFRGRCLRQYTESVAAASWDSVIFDIPGRESLQRVPTLEPLRGTKAHVGELFDRCRTAAELVAALTGETRGPSGPAISVRDALVAGRGGPRGSLQHLACGPRQRLPRAWTASARKSPRLPYDVRTIADLQRKGARLSEQPDAERERAHRQAAPPAMTR